MNENEKVEELQEKQMEDQNLQQLSNEELKEKIEENSNNNANVTGPVNKKSNGGTTALIIILIIVGAVVGFFYIMWPSIQSSIQNQWVKPILYLYPEEDMDVKITFDNEKL